MLEKLFPIIQPELIGVEAEELPLYQECAWDFEKEVPILENGEPKLVTSNEAIKVWIWKTLKTPVARYPIYNFEHGTQLEELVGQNYIPELKQSEAARYVREALEVNPYIIEITDITVGFQKTKVSITATIKTVYEGEVIVHV